VYEVNLSTYKRTRILGKETNVKEVKNSAKVKYYDALMTIDNQLYYVRSQNTVKPTIYKYSKKGKDKKIYAYDVDPIFVLGTSCEDSTKFVCQTRADSYRDPVKAMVYDLKNATLTETVLPDDCYIFDFITGNMVFYMKENLDYLSSFCYE
jgi:hypothetical protein